MGKHVVLSSRLCRALNAYSERMHLLIDLPSYYKDKVLESSNYRDGVNYVVAVEPTRLVGGIHYPRVSNAYRSEVRYWTKVRDFCLSYLGEGDQPLNLDEPEPEPEAKHPFI